MQLESIPRNEYNGDYDNVILEQWKTCVDMANSNTEKRNSSNSIFITINTAILAILQFSLDYKNVILSFVGIVVCIVWISSLNNYKKLSSVKYHIVNEIEQQLPLQPFNYEWGKLKTEKNYLELTKIEKYLPRLFILLYLIVLFIQLIEAVFDYIVIC